MMVCVLTKCVKTLSAVRWKCRYVFALGGPQGNSGQKSVLVKKPVSRKFIVLSSIEMLVFCWQPIAYTFIINIHIYIYIFIIFVVVVVFMFGRIHRFIRVGLECINIVYGF